MLRIIFQIICLSSVLLSSATLTYAVEPEYFYVKGLLNDLEGNPLTGLFDVRASLWTSADKTTTGTENALWVETHSTTIDQDGKFEIKVGSRNDLPVPFNLDLFEYIQLEIKLATSNSDYQHLDPRNNNDSIDRNPIMRYPYRPKYNTNAEIQAQSQNNSFSLDENGQLSMNILPSELSTTLTSLGNRITSLEERTTVLETQIQDQLKTYNSESDLTEIAAPSIGQMHYIIDEKSHRFFDGQSWDNVAGISPDKAINKTNLHHSEIINIHTSQQASPGIFYWDRTLKSYYVGMADGSLKPLFGDSDLPGFIHNSWIDFRFANIDNMVIEKSNTVFITQHDQFGLNMRSSYSNWSQALAWPEQSFERSTERTFEYVFRTGDSTQGRVMIGLADANLDVASLTENSFNRLDTGLYLQASGNSDKLYGQDADGELWYETFIPENSWQSNSFYKVIMRANADGGLKNNWRIEKVNEADWTMVESVLYEGVTYNTANSTSLKPFILLGGNQSGGDSNDYHLTGFRVY
jgi:hypothetical protein